MSNISQNDAIGIDEIVDAINFTNRQLATIQVIQELRSIPGADRIVVAIMENLGWECVVKKDEFKVGDKIIYIEVDSICPQIPVFEFLRERKFRVRTIKLKKQISHGLIIPLNTLSNSDNYKVGEDVSKVLGIEKYDPEGRTEQALIVARKHSFIMRFLMNISAFRYIYHKLNKKVKGNFPSWVKRSDETRIQVCAKHLMQHYDEAWEITEKLDGQSHTAFIYPMKIWGRIKSVFGVCSRSIWLKTPGNSQYWGMARKYELERILKSEGKDIYIQSEQCGPGIQGNKYKLSKTELYIFNLVINGYRMSYAHILNFCQKYGLKPVPLVNGTFIPIKEIGENKSVIEVVQYMVRFSQGNSLLLNRPREGIVMRLKSNPDISLKVINPEFKIEQEKEEDREDREDREV